MNNLAEFYKGKKIFVTGNTGFKGSWLCTMLLHFGAEVYGYSNEKSRLFLLAELGEKTNTTIADIRDYNTLQVALCEATPDIIFHLAAQPLVIEGYNNPRETYETNVMGTVNILEAARNCPSVKVLLNITTDKVYQNNEWHWGYRETDRLNGYDPYSNSKSCSELITDSYTKSFFNIQGMMRVGTARAGNVIGGGDFAENRIIPDCILAAQSGKPIVVRNKDAIRPWQHVLEPLSGYLTFARALFLHETLEMSFNFGPNDNDCVDVGTLVDMFCMAWGPDAVWEHRPNKDAVHEATFLKLDCSKARNILFWQPRLSIFDAIQLSVEWQKQCNIGMGAWNVMHKQIDNYLQDNYMKQVLTRD